MKYRVRNDSGELEFASFAQLKEGAQQGFVEPSDEVLKEGQSEWQPASAVAGLWAKPSVHAQRHWLQRAKIALAVAGSGAAMWMIHRGDYGLGLLLAFLVVGLAFHITATTQRRSS